MTFEAFASAVRTYCALTGGSVTSWGRTPWHNHVVGGVAQSAHQYWLAADARQWEHYSAAERIRVREWAATVQVVDVAAQPPVWATSRSHRSAVAERLGLRVIFEDDHEHLQPADWKAG